MMRLECEVETLDWSCAFNCQLLTDALFLFEAADLVTTGAAVLLDETTTLFFQVCVFHEIRGWIAWRRGEREEISSDVARVCFGQAEVWHHRHVLHLQLSAIVRAARMQFSVIDVW